MIIKNNNISKKVTFLLFSIFFLIGASTFKDYGISVDEEWQRFSGFYWLNYILSFIPFENFKISVNETMSQIGGFTLPSIEGNKPYGVIFDLPVAFLEVLFQIEDSKNYYHLRHFLNFLVFFISSIFFFKLLLNRFSDNYISIIGTLFYILSPRIYGNSFYNNKDIIFLSLLTIALFFCFKVIDKINFKNLFLFSLFAAICTCSRILGVFLIIAFLIFYLFSIISNRKYLKNLSLVFVFLILYLFFTILFWPYLWSDPINNLAFSFKFFSSFPLHPKMLFNGEYVNSHLLPSHYIFTWIFITTPILYIALFIIGYFQILKRFFLRFINIKENEIYDDFWRSVNEKKDLYIFFNITIIVAYLISFNTPLYSGWRHIYILNTFIIYISVVGFYHIGIYLRRKLKKNFHYHISILFLIFIAYRMTIYHPFQNIYFNNYFNNISHLNFEIDYWGLSGKKFLKDTLNLEKNKSIINIGVASWLPLSRSVKILDKNERGRILIVERDFGNADYLYTNFISEVDKNFNYKYKIPPNFIKIDEFVLDNIKVYEVFKKKKN